MWGCFVVDVLGWVGADVIAKHPWLRKGSAKMAIIIIIIITTTTTVCISKISCKMAYKGI